MTWWACLVAAPAAAQDTTTRVLDPLDDVSAWTAAPSDGVSLRIARDPAGHRGAAMRLDVDFHGGGGYAVARRALPLEFPPNYELAFWVRGQLPPNNVEVKLVDATGDNVWWVNRRDYAFPERWTRFVIKKRHVSFAWGPLGGGELRRSAAIEIAITAGSGGRGTVWIDELTLAPRPPVDPNPPPPRAVASASAPRAPAALAVDGKAATAWRAPAAGPAWLALDLRGNREYGGLVIDWAPGAHASDYDVETSADGSAWATAYAVRGGDGGRDYAYMPETESRWVRVNVLGGGARPPAIREVAVKPLAWSASLNALFFANAKDAPRGSLPRAFTDSVQSYWTIVGAPAAEREAMINDDGAVEVNKGAFSLEPFLRVDDRVATWADVRRTQTLDGGDLPIPSVRWDLRGRDSTLALTTTAFVDGPADSAVLVTRYRVENRGRAPRRATLYVTVRPFQVNPPWQFLNTPGGTAPVRDVAYADGVVRVNGGRGAEGPPRGETVVPVTRPAAFGASTFDAGGVIGGIRRGALPDSQRAFDALGRASGALAYPLDVPAGAHRDVVVAVPFDPAVAPPVALDDAAAAAWAESRLARTRAAWADRLGGVTIRLPRAAERLAQTLRTTQAYVLINQDGPAIQPGSRSYERSWIRDGSLTSAALLRTGHADRVRAFLAWYAPYQYANGKVPCCVDRRGADPVPENDSHGQLIFLAREYHDFTGDRATLQRLWPNVVRAVAYIDSLRRTRRTDRYRSADSAHLFGLMPPSISHEGYSDKAAYSYWDDAFTIRGLKDAAAIARVLGKADTAARFQAIADEFTGDVIRSIEASMRRHRIDFIPGAADRGDFDATSTTVLLTPAGVQRALPQAALRATFERYWREHRTRAAGTRRWENYTPYEWRTVGSFVRLGQPERAHALIDFFFSHQRPPGWNHWAEVVWRDPATPRFVGDMPHTWVGSDFVRSVLDLFAYEEEADSALVVGAGIPDAWARADSGVALLGLRTPYGPLDVEVHGDARATRVRLGGAARDPAGGVIVHAPFPRRPRSATVNGAAAALRPDGAVVVRNLPATVQFDYE